MSKYNLQAAWKVCDLWPYKLTKSLLWNMTHLTLQMKFKDILLWAIYRCSKEINLFLWFIKLKNIPSYFSLQEISFGDGKEVVLTDVFVLQIHLGHKHVSHQWMAIYTSHYITCHIWLPFEPQHPSWYSWNKYVYKL